MFRFLGKIVERGWPAWLVGWAAAFTALWVYAPPWEQVGKSGQLAYLPADAPTRRAEELFDVAFPGQRAGSAVLVAVCRSGGDLTPDDLRFAAEVLPARLR